MQHVMITGSNRGIGLALVREFLARGDVQLFATCRNPDQAQDLQELAGSHPDHICIVQLEVTQQASIVSAFEKIARQTRSLDIVINNAGIDPPRQTFDAITADLMLQVYAVNTVAPLMISKAAQALLKNSDNARLVHISSQMASLEYRTYGGDYAYCSSKAALNMAMRGMASDLQKYGIIVVAVDPGWVRTDMGGSGASLSPQESARGVVTVIDDLESSDNGRYLAYDGREHPW